MAAAVAHVYTRQYYKRINTRRIHCARRGQVNTYSSVIIIYSIMYKNLFVVAHILFSVVRASTAPAVWARECVHHTRTGV